MKLQEKVEQTVASGVMPITLLHDTVCFFDEAPVSLDKIRVKNINKLVDKSTSL